MARHFENLRAIFLKGVNSVQPSTLFNQSGIIKRINAHMIKINDQEINLTNKKCHLVGFGKAVLGMAVQMERVLDKNLKSGLISVPIGILNKFENNPDMRLKKNSAIKIYEGAENNLPDENALEAAKNIFALASSMSSDDILFVLISGGGSALLPLPLEPLTLSTKLDIIRQLSNAGATIEELNTVRIFMSKIKGGKLAMAAKNANLIISFIISDIIGNPIDLIASGPTINYKIEDCKLIAKSILEKFHLWKSLSDECKSVFEILPQDLVNSETFPHNNHIFVVGNNQIAVESCYSESKKFSYNSCILSTSIKGKVEVVSAKYAELIRNLLLYKKNSLSREEFEAKFPFDRKTLQSLFTALELKNSTLLLIFGGEPSVNVTGRGLGGRSQELALRISLECFKDELLHRVCILCAGTDGIDGPTTAAGAFGCSDVIETYIKDNNKTITEILDCYVKNNDSFNFYKHLQNGCYHINTGHTGTNVMDLHLIIVE